MEIKTKYDIGDKVWCRLNPDKIIQDSVAMINIGVDCMDGVEIVYTLWCGVIKCERRLYATKEELLEHET